MDEPKLPEPAGPPDPGIALLLGLVVGYGYYWFATRNAEPAEEDDDGEDVEDEEIERPRRVGKYADMTTDALIDRPAVIASSGRAGDCSKAVKLLPKSAMLAQTQSEKKIFKRVLRSVVEDCGGAAAERAEVRDAVENAVDQLEDVREEIEDLFDVDTSAADSDPERILKAKRAAAIREEGLTRTRRKRVPRNPETDLLDKVSAGRGATSRGGRPSSGASHRFKKPGGPWVRMKAEKAKTKRGFKWRKEEI